LRQTDAAGDEAMMTGRLFRGSALLFVMLVSAAVQAAEGETGSAWSHEATVYLWLPSVDGTSTFPSSGGDVSVDAGDILSALDMAFMGAIESRNGPWSVIADFIYLDLSDSGDTVLQRRNGPGIIRIPARVDMELKGWTSSLLLGHALHETQAYRIDVAAGMRYFDVETDATLTLTGPVLPNPPSGTLTKSAQLLDAIVAVRGRYAFSPDWSLRYHLDFGTGDSDLTWQAAGGLVWDQSWGNVKLLYRHLAYDQKDGALLQDFSFSGPLLGVGFRF
jgi:hypothetical protein